MALNSCFFFAFPFCSCSYFSFQCKYIWRSKWFFQCKNLFHTTVWKFMEIFFEGWNFLFLLLFHSFTTDASAHSGKSICRFEISSFGNAWALNGWTEDWRTFLIWLRDYIEKFDLATLSSPRWCWDNCLFFWQCWSANLFCEMQKKLSRNFFFNTFLFADETSQNVCS